MVEKCRAVTICGIAAGDLGINNASVRRILVLVEPDDSVREALTVLLEGEGWQVKGLADCTDLLSTLEAGVVLAVISESRVPGCTPQQILEIGADRRLPVIFTGHDLPLQGAVDLIRQGATDFLDKPFPQSRLLDLLERLDSGENS